jgi:hypothetical protein
VATPEAIDLARDCDLRGRGKDLWIRRSLLALIALIPLLALFDASLDQVQWAVLETSGAIRFIKKSGS